MKKILILAVACALVSGAALAVWDAQDVVPASSLLVPYAVVDTVGAASGDTPDPTGFTTLFALINVSAAPQIVHMTVWNCISQPVVDWDVYLTGYDVWTINFADLMTGDFQKFDTAVSASATKPFGYVAPSGYSFTPTAYGPSSNATSHSKITAGVFTAFPTVPGTCRMPYGNLNSLGSTIRRKIRAAEVSIDTQYYDCVTSGTNDFINGTWTADLSKAPLFFYMTADVVKGCTTTFQNDLSYWTVGTNAKANVITGDILYINPTHNYSEMLNAVHLEALPTGAVNTAYYTFYALDIPNAGTMTYAQIKPWDDREPLGNAYAFRYATAPAALTSNAIVWKSNWELTIDPYDSSLQSVLACMPYYYYAWNEDELTKSTTGGPSGFNVLQPNAIPFQTQSVPMTTANWPGLVTIATPGGIGGVGYGWVWIVFDGGDQPFPAIYPYEAWVGVSFIFGNYASAAKATLLDNPFADINAVYLVDNPKPY